VIFTPRKELEKCLKNARKRPFFAFRNAVSGARKRHFEGWKWRSLFI
jgi:hypothetical protein